MNYRTGVWSGLGSINSQGGWNPDPVPPPANYETCNAVDSACTARNLAKNIAHEQAVSIAMYGHDGDGNGPLGYLDKTKNPYLGPPVVVNPPVIQAPALQALLAPNTAIPTVKPVSNVAFPIDGATTPGLYNPDVAGIPADGKLVVTSSGVPTAAATATASTTFDFTAVPWYVWAGGAAAAFYLFGGQSGR
jgi:hypothetical protein